MAHQELGQQLLDRVKKDTVEIAKVKLEPRFEGRADRHGPGAALNPRSR